MGYRQAHRRKGDEARPEPGHVRRRDGAGAEEQVAALHSAIGNAAFTQLVAREAPVELVARAKKGGKKASGSKQSGGGGGGGGTPGAPPTLRIGSQGGAVVDLQTRLSSFGHPVGQDGIFGRQTDTAVRAFQGENDLDADGIVGPKTWAALGVGTASPPQESESGGLSEFFESGLESFFSG